MRLSERFARWAAGQVVTADLGRGPVPVSGWVFDGTGGTGSATFGPYRTGVKAQGVTVSVDGADEFMPFGSPLDLPAGVTFVSTVRLGDPQV